MEATCIRNQRSQMHDKVSDGHNKWGVSSIQAEILTNENADIYFRKLNKRSQTKLLGLFWLQIQCNH